MTARARHVRIHSEAVLFRRLGVAPCLWGRRPGLLLAGAAALPSAPPFGRRSWVGGTVNLLLYISWPLRLVSPHTPTFSPTHPAPRPKCPVARKRVEGPPVAPADAFQRGALAARAFSWMAAGSCGSIFQYMAATIHAGATTTKQMRQSSASETWPGSLMSRAPLIM